MKHRAIFAAALGLPLSAQDDAAAGALRLPAFSGYAHPDARAVRRDDATGGVRGCRGELRFYVVLARAGDLTIDLERPAGGAEAVSISVASHPDGNAIGESSEARFAAEQTRRRAASVAIERPGTYRLALSGTEGGELGAIHALHLGGTAVENARALTVERRNASSVHLAYRAPDVHRDEIEWFHCELEPTADPLWTYYMATGWHRGYFGMQVNSETERRLIFSVWDSGDEAVDRNKVAEDDRVQLVRKAEGVHAGGFGNEGTGGHSHLVHDWRLGDRIRFLVHAEPEGTHTTYTGFYQHLRDGRPMAEGWQLLASFRAPKDGAFLRGLYSFSENFSGANGDAARECLYENVWLRTKGGEWLPVREARFTHDGHGKEHRLDRRAAVRGQAFVLRHGDYATEPMPFGTVLELPPPSGPAAPPALPR